MRKAVVYIMLVALSLSLGLLCACNLGGSSSNGKGTYQKISPQEAKQMMDSGVPYVLVDVRTAGEYAEKRIVGAILIPNDEISARAASELPDKDARIFVYCRSGNRSASAATTLATMGYTNVYDIGGITNWPYATTSG